VKEGADGLIVDAAGNLYAAVRDEARPGIRVYSPNGQIDYIPTPEKTLHLERPQYFVYHCWKKFIPFNSNLHLRLGGTMKFSNQVVVVVGGSSGIGFTTAKAAHAGASVIVGRSQDRLNQASAEIGSGVWCSGGCPK